MHIQNEKNYNREVLPIEVPFIRSMGAIIGAVAEFSGQVNEKRFRNAVAKIKHIYPNLNLALAWDENGKAWFKKSEFDPLSEVREMTSENEGQKVIIEEWNKSFDLENGPLSRFILLKSEKKSDIIFLCHHILSDGIGITIILETFFKLLSDENFNVKMSYINHLPSVENLNKFKPKSGTNVFTLFNELLNKNLANFLNYRWKRSKIHIPPKDAVLSHKMFFNNYDYCPLLDEFSQEETANFIKKCKENKVTVTSAMIMAFLACRKEIDQEHDNFRQIIPVDLRKYLGDETKQAANCYAGSIDMKYAYDTSKTFWENARIYNGLAKNALKNFADIKKVQAISYFQTDFLETSIASQRIHTFNEMFDGVFPYVDKLGPKSHHVTSTMAKFAIKRSPTFCLTNMGNPKFSHDYGSLKLEKLFLYPSGVAYPKLTVLLSVVTLHNRLFFTFHIAKKKTERFEDYEQIALKLKQRYKEFLTKDIFK